uniref:Uncharacterized protein n=1 Tax=Arion vulgaris TaxID=1028688 RepID=A0A0B6Y4M9_9EUPU
MSYNLHQNNIEHFGILFKGHSKTSKFKGVSEDKKPVDIVSHRNCKQKLFQEEHVLRIYS